MRGDASRRENRQNETDREQYARRSLGFRRRPKCRASQFRFGHANRNGPAGLSRMAEDSQQGMPSSEVEIDDALPLCLQRPRRVGDALCPTSPIRNAREISNAAAGRLHQLTSLAASAPAPQDIGEHAQTADSAPAHRRPFRRWLVTGYVDRHYGVWAHGSLALVKAGNAWRPVADILPCVSRYVRIGSGA